MKNEVKEISEKLRIKELKSELLNNRERIFKIRCMMSRLTFNRTVGLYASYLDEIDYLGTKRFEVDEATWLKTLEKIREYDKKARLLESDPEVQLYSNLRTEYIDLLLNSEYYQTLNIDFRNELSKLDLPQVFISHRDFSKHAIDESLKLDERKSFTMIEPLYNIASKRRLRHFYNKTSFRYLEGVSEEGSFVVDRKRLGKVRTITMDRNYYK